jgi:hypothetical protein
MTPDDLEKKSLELGRREIELAQNQLEIDKKRAELDRGFLNRNTGVLIPAAVSLAAIIVSLGQVWAAKISKDKEIQISILQHKQDLESQERQKEHELALSDAQRKRELDLAAAKFIADNRKEIFEGSDADKEVYGKMISALFPPEVAAPVLHRLEIASTGQARKIWNAARQESQGERLAPDKRFSVKGIGDTFHVMDAASGRELRTIRIPSRTNENGHVEQGQIDQWIYSPDGKDIIASPFGILYPPGCTYAFEIATGRQIASSCPQ